MELDTKEIIMLLMGVVITMGLGSVSYMYRRMAILERKMDVIETVKPVETIPKLQADMRVLNYKVEGIDDVMSDMVADVKLLQRGREKDER